MKTTAALLSKPMWIYPGGEVGIHVDFANEPRTPIGTFNTLTHRIQNSDDLVALILLADAYKREGRTLPSIFIPYLPYARQDRVAVRGDPHSLAAIASVIDNLGFPSISVIDAHSIVSEAVFSKTKFTNRSPIPVINQYIDRAGLGGSKNLWLVCPDEGAIKKTQAYAREFKELVAGIMYCTKNRDPETGKLTGFSCAIPYGLDSVAGANLLIIDDIVDGAGTFLGIADMLVGKLTAPKIHLFCTHGIFSRGVDVVYEKFHTVGCSNSFLSDGVSKSERKPIIIEI